MSTMQSKTLTIMFTDIKDFTKRTRVHSREQNLIMLERHEAIIKPCIQDQSGKIIKTLGDSFLAVFESPTNALLAAVKIQKRLEEYNAKVVDEDEKIQVRIGINAGEVLLADDDISGDAVNIAARIVSLAEPGRIFFTEAVFLTMNRSEVRHCLLGEKAVKGIQESVKVYCVLNEGEDDSHFKQNSSATESSFSSAVNYSDEPSLSDDEKITPEKRDEVFDFTNIEFEKKYEENSNFIQEGLKDKSQVEILELDTERNKPKSKGDFGTSKTEAPDVGIEHSKEILESIRIEKSKKKLYSKILYICIFLSIVCAFFLYYYLTKPSVKDLKIEESPILEALEPKETPTAVVTSTPKFKPIKSIDYALIKIITKPSGATIWMDGKKLKWKTPTTLRKILPNKTHKITLKRPGYETYEILFDVHSGEEKEIDVNLYREK